jgi:hypothetical protein
MPGDPLEKRHKPFPRCPFSLCDEPSYAGYPLQRDLAEKGDPCDGGALTHIPNPRVKRIRTDRIAAAQLAQCSANALLRFVSEPEPPLEPDRDVRRCHPKRLEQPTERRKAQTIIGAPKRLALQGLEAV